jgi:P4 family phage/plasmid primase-like protien
LNGLYQEQSVDTIRGRLQALMRQVSTWPNYSGLLRLANEVNLRGVIAFLRGQVEQKHAFRPAANFIHLANGVLVFKDGAFVFERFDPKFKSRNRSPVSYDKDATAPRFRDEFLKPLHPDDQLLIQKYFGQALLGRNITQTILLLDGESATGKTTLAKIMRNLIGMDNTYQLRTSLLNDRFEIGRYIGKTFLIASDVDAKFLSAQGASRLKCLVGGHPIPAELKRNNSPFTVEGVFNVVITSNCRLLVRLQGDVEAWRRRLLVVRYQNPRSGATIADFDKVLIEEEGSGILNFGLEGVSKLFSDLVSNQGRIKFTPEQEARLNKLLDESDSLRVFLKNSLIQDLKSDLTVKEILEEYFKECIDNELSPIPLQDTRKMLDSLMMELFAVSRVNDIKRLGKSQRGFSNVRFK